MKPAWPWCFHANWPTSSWDTTWAASTPSPIACCSLMNPPTRTWASGTFPRRKLQPTRKLIELLKNSPYAQKLNTPGLFLRELSARGPALSALLTPHLGTGFTDRKGAVDHMVVLMNSAPALDPSKLDQIAALPLGGRVKLNAWDDHVELIKITPVAITSARHKMPLEVTPFFPRLTRSGAVVNPADRRERNPKQLERKNGAWKFLHRHADPLVEKASTIHLTHSLSRD